MADASTRPPEEDAPAASKPANPADIAEFLSMLTDERARVARNLEAHSAHLHGAIGHRPRHDPSPSLREQEAELIYLGHVIADLNRRIGW